MKYRVWFKNAFKGPTCNTDWMTRDQCVKHIVNRYGHLPPFAFVSRCKTTKAFIRYNGE